MLYDPNALIVPTDTIDVEPAPTYVEPIRYMQRHSEHFWHNFHLFFIWCGGIALQFKSEKFCRGKSSQTDNTFLAWNTYFSWIVLMWKVLIGCQKRLGINSIILWFPVQFDNEFITFFQQFVSRSFLLSLRS